MRKIIASFILAAFLANTFVPPSYAQVFMPKPGTMVALSPAFHPPILSGVKVYADNPFRFDFILDQGDGRNTDANRLIKYFLASLTVPEKDLWVNLSPYEKDRIVPDAFGRTEMGRDLLAQDYFLKQLTSSLMFPDGDLGKKFWAEVYSQAQEKFGTTDIPVDTFNKVWITPAKAVVYEKKDVAYVVESKLKVMLESDYLSMENNVAGGMVKPEPAQDLSKDLIRQIILPALEKEVNEGKNFAQLRQVYNSLILASWYKKKIKESLLAKVYADQNKVVGVNIADPKEAEKIWAQYVEAFKKGVFDFVKEEKDAVSNEVIPHKYFAGGVNLMKVDYASVSTVDAAALPKNTFVVNAQIDRAEDAAVNGVERIDTDYLDIEKASDVEILNMLTPEELERLKMDIPEAGILKGLKEIPKHFRTLGVSHSLTGFVQDMVWVDQHEILLQHFKKMIMEKKSPEIAIYQIGIGNGSEVAPNASTESAMLYLNGRGVVYEAEEVLKTLTDAFSELPVDAALWHVTFVAIDVDDGYVTKFQNRFEQEFSSKKMPFRLDVKCVRADMLDQRAGAQVRGAVGLNADLILNRFTTYLSLRKASKGIGLKEGQLPATLNGMLVTKNAFLLGDKGTVYVTEPATIDVYDEYPVELPGTTSDSPEKGFYTITDIKAMEDISVGDFVKHIDNAMGTRGGHGMRGKARVDHGVRVLQPMTFKGVLTSEQVPPFELEAPDGTEYLSDVAFGTDDEGKPGILLLSDQRLSSDFSKGHIDLPRGTDYEMDGFGSITDWVTLTVKYSYGGNKKVNSLRVCIPPLLHTAAMKKFKGVTDAPKPMDYVTWAKEVGPRTKDLTPEEIGNLSEPAVKYQKYIEMMKRDAKRAVWLLYNSWKGKAINFDAIKLQVVWGEGDELRTTMSDFIKEYGLNDGIMGDQAMSSADQGTEKDDAVIAVEKDLKHGLSNYITGQTNKGIKTFFMAPQDVDVLSSHAGEVGFMGSIFSDDLYTKMMDLSNWLSAGQPVFLNMKEMPEEKPFRMFKALITEIFSLLTMKDKDKTSVATLVAQVLSVAFRDGQASMYDLKQPVYMFTELEGDRIARVHVVYSNRYSEKQAYLLERFKRYKLIEKDIVGQQGKSIGSDVIINIDQAMKDDPEELIRSEYLYPLLVAARIRDDVRLNVQAALPGLASVHKEVGGWGDPVITLKGNFLDARKDYLPIQMAYIIAHEVGHIKQGSLKNVTQQSVEMETQDSIVAVNIMHDAGYAWEDIRKDVVPFIRQMAEIKLKFNPGLVLDQDVHVYEQIADGVEVHLKNIENTGGIDLTPARMDLQTKGEGAGMAFNFDPAMIVQFKNAAGFRPVILSIQPMADLPKFLGVEH